MFKQQQGLIENKFFKNKKNSHNLLIKFFFIYTYYMQAL